jgi:3-methyladenine DNA glycosylase/8-oxoguanine DNA glycosylase
MGVHVPSDHISTDSLRIPVEAHGHVMLIDLAQRGSPVAAEIACTRVAGADATGATVRALVGRRIEHLLGASDAPAAFYDLAREDDSFWRMTQTLEGLHRVGFATPLEGICWTILRQRQYPNVARARLHRLRLRFGPAVEHDGELHHAFPTAARLAAASLEAIRKEVKSRKKARYVREAAAAFAAMGDDLDLLGDPPDELEERLKEIRGVGPWSARALLAPAFCRPHLDHVVAEGTLTPYWHDVLGRFYGPGFDAVQARERADHYGKWESYWLFYARFTHLAMKRAAKAAIVDV